MLLLCPDCWPCIIQHKIQPNNRLRWRETVLVAKRNGVEWVGLGGGEGDNARIFSNAVIVRCLISIPNSDRTMIGILFHALYFIFQAFGNPLEPQQFFTKTPVPDNIFITFNTLIYIFKRFFKSLIILLSGSHLLFLIILWKKLT